MTNADRYKEMMGEYYDTAGLRDAYTA